MDAHAKTKEKIRRLAQCYQADYSPSITQLEEVAISGVQGRSDTIIPSSFIQPASSVAATTLVDELHSFAKNHNRQVLARLKVISGIRVSFNQQGQAITGVAAGDDNIDDLITPLKEAKTEYQEIHGLRWLQGSEIGLIISMEKRSKLGTEPLYELGI